MSIGNRMLKMLTILLIVLIPASGDLAEVEDLVNSHHFNQVWEEDVFDCADMASANWQFFKDRGYNPKIVVRTTPDPGDHCYIIIPIEDGRVVGLDTSIRMGANRSKNIGAILTTFTYYRVFDDPDELANYDKSISEGRRGPYNYRGVIDENTKITGAC